jgi:hypothetical protein
VILADKLRPVDQSKLFPGREKLTEARANIEKLTRQLERGGVDGDKASAIAERIAVQAEGPISNGDWMTLDATRLSDVTQQRLARSGLTHEAVLSDANKAEDYTARVLELEGIPNGDGGVDKFKRGVASGHYDKRGNGGVGIDLVGADQNGVPISIEVKKYQQTSAAHLENRSVERLEPEVANWKAQREQAVRASQENHLTNIRSDAQDTWKPEVADWRRDIARDQVRMAETATGELPVQQMDDLWIQDRWLKLIKTQDGQQRMRDIGVDAKYLDYDRLRSSPNLPEWRDILDRRTTVVVSDSHGSVGKAMFFQAIRDGRSKSVMKIEG